MQKRFELRYRKGRLPYLYHGSDERPYHTAYKPIGSNSKRKACAIGFPMGILNHAAIMFHIGGALTKAGKIMLSAKQDGAR